MRIKFFLLILIHQSLVLILKTCQSKKKKIEIQGTWIKFDGKKEGEIIKQNHFIKWSQIKTCQCQQISNQKNIDWIW
jgi:hypothetical protein